MTRPIGFYVHHHGSGHVTRAVQIARACTSPVVGFSTMPEPSDWPGRWVNLPDDAAPVTDDQDASAGGILHWAPTGEHPYPERMRLLAAALTEADPALLHVDVSVEVTLLARLLGIPVTVAAMRGDRSDLPHGLAYDTARILLAPWPAELPERTWPEDVLTKTIHVGGISRFDGQIDDAGVAHGLAATAAVLGARDATAPDVPASADEREVFVLWGRGGGDWPEHVWEAAHAATRPHGWRWRHGAESDAVWDHLRSADVVIAHAGQNAVAEVAAARTPAIVVALERPHGEQVATMNALTAGDLAEVIDAADGTDLGELDLDWVRLLDDAFRRDGQQWRRWTDGHGAARAAFALETVAAGRLPAVGTAVVTLVHDRHDHLRGLIAGLARGTHLPERLVVVAMDDPEVDAVCERACAGSGLRVDVTHVDAAQADGRPALPLAHARNVGAARAGEVGCATLVFLDVDCIPSPDLVRTYAEAVGSGSANGEAGSTAPTIWSGPVTYLPPAPEGGYDPATLVDLADPHPARPAPAAGEVIRAEDVRLFWSLSFALSLRDYRRVGGFCEDYVGYGGEDTDFAMRLDAADGDLIWLGGADAYHQYHPTQKPPTQHLDDIVRNANLFATTWGWHPMEGWLEAFAEAGIARYDEHTRRWIATDGAS